jgi:hypothetical protein
MTEKSISAVIQKVIKEGKRGGYVVATSQKIKGSITFSLGGDVWQEETLPEVGVLVVLSDLRRKRAGWRAFKARFFRPADEQIADRKEQGNESEK